MKILIIIIILGSFLRLYGLNWDQGHYLHPDERLYVNASNISLPKSFEEFLSPDSPLNPNMFYYGPLPLYLYKPTSLFILPDINFLITSRLVSALFSILTIPLIFLIAKHLFSKKIAIISAFIFAFAAGSIQYAHFNTTESILVFLLSAITLLSIKIIKEKNDLLFIPLGILIGISFATKITGLVFAFIPGIALLHLAWQRKISLAIVWSLLFTALIISVSLILAPYQIIDFPHFQREQEYMQGVTYGKYKPPFVIIYEGTLPYLYPLIKILPFTFGFISLPLAILGFILILKKIITQKENVFLYSLILVFPILYFLWTGAWYAKFSRYFILLFPFLSIWAAFTLEKFKNILLFLFIFFIGLNGLFFFRIYLQTNTRLSASDWIYENIPQGSSLAGEHWDDHLPVNFNLTRQPTIFDNFDLTVYDEDTPQKIQKLSQDLFSSDYFVISSRRVYYSILQNKEKYPYTGSFYQLLFQEKLGFKLEKKFTSYPYFFSDDWADETFQSYDHPPVFIFKNETKLPAELIRSEIVKNAVN